MITNFQLFEGKQVGIIYHFTSIYNLYKILSEREPSIRPIRTYISCTRNFNMKSEELKLEKQCCRIALDGNKISQKYKITPYLDNGWENESRNQGTYFEEREERIMTIDRLDLKKYCVRIDILNNPPYKYDGTPNRNAINTYTFKLNQYLDKEHEINHGYELLKNQITSLNSSLPVFFVDKMRPVKLNENLIDVGISPPRIRKSTGGGDNYLYYAIFEELFIPKNLVRLISPVTTSSGSYLINNIIKKNPYRKGLYDFIIDPRYVDTIKINDKKYDKLILNNYLKSPSIINENSIKKLHEDLMIEIYHKYNDDDIDLKSLLKFNNFSIFENKKIDEDWWESLLDGMKK